MVTTVYADTWARSSYALSPMAVRCDLVADATEWATFTGSQPDFIHAFAYSGAGSTWATNLSYAQGVCTEFVSRKLVWALPIATSTQNMAATTAGTHDASINAILDLILAHNPIGPIYIRPGWEMANFGATWPWAANTGGSSRTDYIAAFQKVAALIRAKSSRFVIIWCVNVVCYGTTGGSIADPTDAATGFNPGVAHFDAVGIDTYMIGVEVSNAKTVDSMSISANRLLVENWPFGLQYLADYARANNKLVTIDEWGVGADRPDFIRDMKEFIGNPRNRVAYHGYWNKNAPAGSPPYQFPCRLSDTSNNYPKAKAQFLSSFYGVGSDVTEQAETSALIARTTSTVTDVRRAAYDKLIRDLKIGGVLDYLDGLYVLAGQDNNITMINLLGAGGFTTTVPRSTGRCAIVGTPAFVADRSFTGDGTTGSYLSSGGTNMLSALNKAFTQNSAHMGIWSLTAINPASQSGECGVASSFIGRNSAGTWVGRPNTASTLSLTGSSAAAGHVLWNRTGSAAWAAYLNGVAANSGTDASAAITNDNLRICGTTGAGGSNQIAIMHFGRALPASSPFNGPQVIYNALLAYLQSVGAV